MVRQSRTIHHLLSWAIIFAIIVSFLAIVIRHEYIYALDKIEKRPLSQCGTSLSKDEISSAFIAGVLAQEDFFFFTKGGVNYQEIISSLFRNIKEAKIARGASTITMQVASLCYPNENKNRWLNKFQEIILAEALSRKFSKLEILRAYLTIVPLAPDSKITGFPQASKYYFNKKITELTYEEMWRLIFSLRNRESLNPNEIKNLDDLRGTLRYSLIRAQKRQTIGFAASTSTLEYIQRFVEELVFE